jgi:hypothetical protein
LSWPAIFLTGTLIGQGRWRLGPLAIRFRVQIQSPQQLHCDWALTMN